MTNQSTMRLPIWHDVDVLVVGASSGAVAAALAVRKQNRTALVVDELSYFGEESAGTLNLWPAGLDKTDALVNNMFTTGNDSFPALPCHVKQVLETALLQATVPFLYLSRPVAILRGEDGRLIGAIIAARTSLFVIRCSAIIDATRYGVVARLAGVTLTARNDLPQTLAWNVISDGVPVGWETRSEELHPLFRVMSNNGASTYGAYRLLLDRAMLGNDPIACEHSGRSLLVVPNLLVTADIIPDVPAQFCAVSDSCSDGPASLTDGAFAGAPDIFLLNGLLPLTSSGVLALERIDIQAEIGRRVGVLAANAVRRNKENKHTCVTAFTGKGIGGDFRFAPAFLRHSEGILALSPLAFPNLGRFDVVVAGGGTGGAPAGISAARAGARTVVLEAQHGLGGVGTIGLVSDYWYGNQVGFTAELDVETGKTDAECGRTSGRQWRPEIKAAVYHRLLKEAGAFAWLGSYAFGVRVGGKQVDGVLVSTPFGCGLLETGCVVDATGNADIAAAAGAPCRVMGAEHLASQGTGLSPRAHPGVRIQNSDHTFVDDTDPEGVTAAFVNARAKFPDFFDTSPIINSRERRQIIGEYEVSPLDILANRTFDDTVFIARSNFDTHGFIVHPVFMVAEPDEDSTPQANVPFRCMLPRGLEGVLVIGLGMSAHRDALPLLRMQADVQNQGFVAGLAATWSAIGCRYLRDLDIRALQKCLVKSGVLPAAVVAESDSFPLSNEAVANAAQGALRAPLNAAILFAHPEKSRHLLQVRLGQDTPAGDRLDAALILGLMGFSEAAPVLTKAVSAQAWDDGWSYTGMGQFGPSLSRLDVLILALARTRDPAAASVIETKIRELQGTPAFSHCRVVAIAAALLRNDALTQALAGLLRLPGMQGHFLCDMRAMLAKVNGEMNETKARNVSLRELYLARGLFLAGDVNGLGRATLEAYACDLRGHYARHARAVLEQVVDDDSLMKGA